MKKRIIIADMDEQYCNELVKALEVYPEYEVIGAAADGKEALKIAREYHPNLVILDLLLPQYDGITVLDRISALYADCKFLVVTGFISDYILSALKNRQGCVLIKKPRSVQSVIDCINEEF